MGRIGIVSSDLLGISDEKDKNWELFGGRRWSVGNRLGQCGIGGAYSLEQDVGLSQKLMNLFACFGSLFAQASSLRRTCSDHEFGRVLILLAQAVTEVWDCSTCEMWYDVSLLN